MCGGWRWSNHDWKPTPQPGDFVRIRVCRVCRKRARSPRILHEQKFIRDSKVRVGMRDDGVECATNISGFGKLKTLISREVQLGSCCHKTWNHIEVIGRVERTVWSKDRHRSPNKFFFIVFVPIFDKRVWVNLEAHIELVTANDYLIHNVPDD